MKSTFFGQKLAQINLVYCSLPVAAFALFQLGQNFGAASEAFFGFAENKETQINLPHAATVARIGVAAGQFVRKGQVLAEVERSELDLKMSEVEHGIARLESQKAIDRAGLQAELGRLRAQKTEKTAQTERAIAELRTKLAQNESLVRGLKSRPADEKSRSLSSPIELQIQSMRDELRLALAPIDIEIRRIEAETRSADPVQSQIAQLRSEQKMVGQQRERLTITAPADGLIGAINCKIGENLPAFTALFSFYEQNPNQIIAFVHESMMLEVRVGDSMRVASILRPEQTCAAAVSGLGHRIVEIPERLRKIPEIRSFGREVLLQIAPENGFLQNEKVFVAARRPARSAWAFWFAGEKGERLVEAKN